MSIGTMTRKVHNSTPQDELIGSLTRERVSLLAYEAGYMAQNDLMAGRCWLAYALNVDIPVNAFEQLYYAVQQAEMIADCDLEHWYDVPNTEDNRESLQYGANVTIDFCVTHLTNLLCTQLGVQS